MIDKKSKDSGILCVHYYFPPLRSSAVIRNYYIANTLSQFFQIVHVLTSDNYNRFPNQEEPLAKNLKLHSIYTLDYRRLLANKGNDSHKATTKKKRPFFLWLLKLQKSFPFNVFLAEGNLIYIIGAYNKAKKLIRENDISVIYSSFGPYADHFVAYLLKKKFPHLKWIADYRDLQIEPIYKNVIWESLQFKVEKKILSHADLITCISDGFKKQLELYDRPVKKILRGVEMRPQISQYNKFTIAYTGSLYFEYRDPRPLFEVLKSLMTSGDIEKSNTQIIYAGRDGSQFSEWVNEYDLKDVFKNLGMVSQAKAKEIQDKSHINLLLTSSSKELTGVITGKIFEYLEAHNPVLCLINGVQDPEFELLFEELNAGSVVYHPPLIDQKMTNFLLDKYNEWKCSGQVSSSINTTLIKSKYSWSAQVSNMFN